MAGLSFSAEQVNQLNQMASAYEVYLRNKLNAALQSGKFNVTNALKDSLQVRTTPATANSFPSFTISYALHGNLIEIKRMRWNQQPNVAELQEWILANGKLNRFSSVPGYKGTAPISRAKAAERVAWAMAKSKQYYGRTKNTHQWKGGKQGALGQAKGYISHLVSEIVAEMAVKAIVQPLTAK
jgi:hypothetical protein